MDIFGDIKKSRGKQRFCTLSKLVLLIKELQKNYDYKVSVRG